MGTTLIGHKVPVVLTRSLHDRAAPHLRVRQRCRHIEVGAGAELHHSAAVAANVALHHHIRQWYDAKHQRLAPSHTRCSSRSPTSPAVTIDLSPRRKPDQLQAKTLWVSLSTNATLRANRFALVKSRRFPDLQLIGLLRALPFRSMRLCCCSRRRAPSRSSRDKGGRAGARQLSHSSADLGQENQLLSVGL